jgi:hypothetical protein
VRLVERLYRAAARAGLLRTCRWHAADGTVLKARVGFQAPDEALLEGLAAGTEYAISYPANRLPRLAAGERVEIDGHLYRVREVRAVGDGSERHATLARL